MRFENQTPGIYSTVMTTEARKFFFYIFLIYIIEIQNYYSDSELKNRHETKAYAFSNSYW